MHHRLDADRNRRRLISSIVHDRCSGAGRSPGRHTHRTMRGILVLGLLVGLVPLGARPSAAAAGDVGTEGPAYVEAAYPTNSRAESKVWFADGTWFAAMLKTGIPTSSGRPTADFYIYRLSGTTWVPTGTLLEDRGTTKLDVLSSGTNLYVVSHKFTGNATGITQTDPSNTTRITRFTYDTGTNSYTKVAGFPKVVNAFTMESFSIDIDSSGALWAAWAQAGQVFWQRSTDGGATWSNPSALTSPHAVTSSDDIASIVAFGGSIGIMWSSQTAAHDGFWFVTTAAGSGSVAWSSAAAAYTGARTGDDHISLKSLDGHVYAAVKTSMNTGSNPLLVVLHRTPAGTWSRHTAYVGRTNTTRPVIQLDATHRTAELFVTGPNEPGGTGETGGTVYRKSAPLTTLAFGDGLGEPVMARPASGHINNTSGTKQSLTSSTGLAVIATDAQTSRYWHHAETLVRALPSAPSGVTAKAGNGKVTLSWTAAIAGDLPIDRYRVTATPALTSPLADFPATATGVPHVLSMPNDVTRVFHVQALARGSLGPKADSEPATPGTYVPFISPESFADQQALDFLGRVATGDEKLAARSALVGGVHVASEVILGTAYYRNPQVAGEGMGAEARVTRLYFAYFLRAPDLGGFDYWIGQARAGQSLERISQKFAGAPEFGHRYGTLTNDQFIDLVYQNVFSRPPDSGGKAFWLAKLQAGFARGSFMTVFSDSSESRRRSLRKVTAVIVYRHMLQRMPTPGELAAEIAKPSSDQVVNDVMASTAYGNRIVR